MRRNSNSIWPRSNRFVRQPRIRRVLVPNANGRCASKSKPYNRPKNSMVKGSSRQRLCVAKRLSNCSATKKH